MKRSRGTRYQAGLLPSREFRGGDIGSGGTPWRARPDPVVRLPSPSLGSLIQIVKLRDLDDDKSSIDGNPKISDCKFEASFNWMDSSSPTIMVPGKPPIWKPLGEPTQLSEDNGEYYRDPNAARYPIHPIEPAVRALLAQNPTFPTQEIDVFACGSTIGNLLHFVRDKDYSFRFIAEEIGSTTFFVRRENAPDEKLQDVRGYGHAFPEAYTPWEENTAGSASHQRMISYTFAGLKYIIRSESDGYLPEELRTEELSSDDKDKPQIPADSDNLTIQAGGKCIPQHAVFDLKTRSAKRKDDDILAEQIGRLWVNQTPNFVLAFHEKGLFTDIRVTHVRDDIEKWERDHSAELRKLAVLVNKIAVCARSSLTGRCEVRSRVHGVLELRDAGEGTPYALPRLLGQRWDGGKVASDSDSEAGGAGLAWHEDGDSVHGYDDEPSWSDDDDEVKDYTACSAEDCGYCGRCRY